MKNEVDRQKRADIRQFGHHLLDNQLSRKLGNFNHFRDLRNPLKRLKSPAAAEEYLLEAYFSQWSRIHTVYCHYSAASNDVNAMVYHVIFDETGQYILSASVDGLIKIFNKSLQLVQTIRGHKRDISILAMSSNNKFVVSVDEGGIARIWDFPSGK